MRISTHSQFKKNYKRRIKSNEKLCQRFSTRLALLMRDSTDPRLRVHKLTGELVLFYAFSVTGDIRCIFRVNGDEIILYDIGSHNQVYS